MSFFGTSGFFIGSLRVIACLVVNGTNMCLHHFCVNISRRLTSDFGKCALYGHDYHYRDVAYGIGYWVLFGATGVYGFFRVHVGFLIASGEGRLSIQRFAFMLFRCRFEGVRREGVRIYVHFLALYGCPRVAIGKLTSVVFLWIYCVRVDRAARAKGGGGVARLFRPFKGRFLFRSSFCFVLYWVSPVRFFRACFVVNRQITY